MTFKDKGLEKMIRDTLGKPQGEVTVEELESIEVIVPSYYRVISDISELKYCKNLKKLEFPSDDRQPITTIKQIDALSELTELKELTLACNWVLSDISPLKNLKKLEVLKLYGNAIEDISVLKELPALRILYLGENPIQDFSPISGMTELVELGLPRLRDNSILSAFTKLQALNIVSCDPYVLNHIVGAKQLSKLTVSSAEHDLDVTALAELSHLRKLEIYAKKIIGAEAISSLKELELLRIQGLTEIDSIQFPESLRVLWLPWQGGIRSIASLKHLHQLQLLEAGWNDIADIEPIRQLVNLEHLALHCNHISDICALANMTNLKCLVLSQNQITDIAPLGNLKNLTNLHLAQNQIEDFSPIYSLPNLVAVNIKENPAQVDTSKFAKKGIYFF